MRERQRFHSASVRPRSRAAQLTPDRRKPRRCGAFLWWARLVSNQRPLACEASALPLSYAPGGRQSRRRPASRRLDVTRGGDPAAGVTDGRSGRPSVTRVTRGACGRHVGPVDRSPTRRVVRALRSLADRARRGGSGALSLAIRSSEAESPPEGPRPAGSARRRGVDGPGSRATSAREPGQVRKEAALSGPRRAQRESPVPEPRSGGSARRPASEEGARSTCQQRVNTRQDPFAATGVKPGGGGGMRRSRSRGSRT
jgi:hypothetical protein